MAQSLEEQVFTVERALGERMIEHALVIVRAWLNEIGENNPYEEAYSSIQTRYQSLFNNWLTSDDNDTDEQLDGLTGEMYQLSDAAYAQIRLKRGLSPDMHGFNPDSAHSVVNYFQHCVKFSQEDLNWLRTALADTDQAAVGILAVGVLAKNLRECFNLDAFMAIIEGAESAKQIVSEQCVANIFLLLIQYDIRIDFFPQIQDAVLRLIGDTEEDYQTAFAVLCAIIEAAQMSMPDEEKEFIQSLMTILPDTWLYDLLVAGNDEREQRMAMLYLKLGRMDLMWSRIEVAEHYLVAQLRKGSKDPQDYLNYGHCLLLKGDRMMAFETYKQARQLCKVKDFYSLFRPDRRMLVEHGVPVEQVYLIEDQLLKSDA